jgi:phosphatidylglycerol:prolipoprotein diacylglycerol transferase
VSILVAIGVATMYCKVKKYDTEMPINIALVVVPVGILSARLFSVIFEDGLSMSEFLNFRTGGMSIIGAVLGGAIGLFVYLIIKRPENKWIYFDTLVVVLILSQAIGRWGNYFNNEVYGQVVEAGTFFAKFPFAVEIDGVYYQALFFYESVLNLVGFLILSLMYLCSEKKGLPTATYLIYYGIVRTVLEQFRQEEYILRLGTMAISRLFSIAMIVIGVALLVLILINARKKKVLNEKE